MFRKNNQQDTPPNLFFPYTRFEHNSETNKDIIPKVEETIENISTFADIWKKLNELLKKAKDISCVDPTAKYGPSEIILKDEAIISRNIDVIKNCILHASDKSLGDINTFRNNINPHLLTISQQVAILELSHKIDQIQKETELLLPKNQKNQKGHPYKILELINEIEKDKAQLKVNELASDEARLCLDRMTQNIQSLLHKEQVPRGVTMLLQELLMVLMAIVDVITLSATYHLVSNEDIRIETKAEKRAAGLEQSFLEFKAAYTSTRPDLNEEVEKQEKKRGPV